VRDQPRAEARIIVGAAFEVQTAVGSQCRP